MKTNRDKHAHNSRHVTNFVSSQQKYLDFVVLFWILPLDTKEYPVTSIEWGVINIFHSQWGASFFRLSRHFFRFATGHHHSTSDLSSSREKKKKERMRFVQFRRLDESSQETIRVGIQNSDNGSVLDLTNALEQPINLVNALAKLGSQGVIDAAATARYIINIFV